MTWFAPMRARILPCDWLIAFAQICGILRSTRFAVMSTLASIDEPTATIATEKSCAPIWRRASMLRASACTAWVTRSDHFCTRSAFSSIARTSRSSLSSCPAAPAPKRPRPMIRTGASCGMRSTNDGPLFCVSEQLGALAGCQRRGEGHCTNSTCPHRGCQDELARVGERFGETRAEPTGAERGDHVEQHVLQRCLRDLHEGDRRDRNDGRTPQDDADGEAQYIRGDAPAEGLHVAIATGFGSGREEQHGKRRNLDAASGGCRTATHEHQHVHDEQARAVHVADVDVREAAGAGHDRQ